MAYSRMYGAIVPDRWSSVCEWLQDPSICKEVTIDELDQSIGVFLRAKAPNSEKIKSLYAFLRNIEKEIVDICVDKIIRKDDFDALKITPKTMSDYLEINFSDLYSVEKTVKEPFSCLKK